LAKEKTSEIYLFVYDNYFTKRSVLPAWISTVTVTVRSNAQ